MPLSGARSVPRKSPRTGPSRKPGLEGITTSLFLTAHLGKRRFLLTDSLDMSPLDCVNLAAPCIGEGSAGRITPVLQTGGA